MKHLNVLYIKTRGWSIKIGSTHVKATTAIPAADDCLRAARNRTINSGVAHHDAYTLQQADYLGELTKATEEKIKRLNRAYRDDASPEVFHYPDQESFDDALSSMQALAASQRLALQLPLIDWAVACQYQDPDHVADEVVARYREVITDPKKRIFLPYSGRLAFFRACKRAGVRATNAICADHDRLFAPFADGLGEFVLASLSTEREWDRIVREFGPFDLIIGNPPFTEGGNKVFYHTILRSIERALAPGGQVAWIAPSRLWWKMLLETDHGLSIDASSDVFKFENARADSRCYFLSRGATKTAPIEQLPRLEVEIFKEWKELDAETQAYIMSVDHEFIAKQPYSSHVPTEKSVKHFTVLGKDLLEARKRLASDYWPRFLDAVSTEGDDRSMSLGRMRWFFNVG